MAYFRKGERAHGQIGGLDIHITKTIPTQAGLGGGSADAAAVLEGLNQMFGRPLQPAELLDLGLSVGADVPFCLVGGTVLAEGVGEIFTAMPTLSNCYIVVAKPQEGVSTAEAFARYDSEGCSRRPDVNRMMAAIVSGDLHTLGQNMCNVLEETVPLEPVRNIHETFEACEALGSVMTGSGSAVIGLFDNKRQARRCYHKMMQVAHSVFLTRPEELGAQVIEKL
jgi:4-diphosphocytidyl-2-C-methyl-D-erythritol kinase